MPKFKATAYIRLSYTDDRSSESDSVSNQRRLIENFVERNPDIEVVSEKIDDGYSGIIFDRPAFKEMMQDITDGNINCVSAGDHHALHLAGALVDLGDLRVTHEPLKRIVPGYAIDTNQINAPPRHIHRRFRGKQFSHIVLRPPMKLQSIEAVKRSVMNDLGIAYVPSFSVEEELKNGSLLQLKTELDDHIFPAVCVYHRNKWISPQMEVAFKILREQLGIQFEYPNSN